MTIDEARQVAARITKMCDIAEADPGPQAEGATVTGGHIAA
ncbi:hypothetical protein [Nocardiopsis chromatogenes]|nr:hypothetical protein [Nocardiopsis chromatogenes]